MMQSTINLLRPAEKETAQVLTIKQEAQKITFFVFLGCVGLGVIVLVITALLNLSLLALQRTNTSLKNQVQQYKQIESMLSVINTRTTVVEKALEYSKPIDIQIGYINEIAPPPILQSFTYDGMEKFTASYKPMSIEETMSMAATLIRQSEEKHITNPRIDSYVLDKEGLRTIFSFSPKWGQL